MNRYTVIMLIISSVSEARAVELGEVYKKTNGSIVITKNKAAISYKVNHELYEEIVIVNSQNSVSAITRHYINKKKFKEELIRLQSVYGVVPEKKIKRSNGRLYNKMGKIKILYDDENNSIWVIDFVKMAKISNEMRRKKQ